MKPSAAAALLLCAFALVALAHGCSFHDNPTDVTLAAGSKGGQTLAGYQVPQVTEFLSNQGKIMPGDARGESFSCVDARAEYPILGTPGGDMAEFMVAIQVLEEKMGKDLTEAQIQELLWKFLDSRFITKNRPFYFHTADGNPRGLNGLFNWLKDNGKVSTLPIIFPERAPANIEDWLDGLVQPVANGCGHIRLMLEEQKNDTVVYSPANPTSCTVPTSDGNTLAYGGRAKFVATACIKAFFRYWWPTELGSRRRDKCLFKVLQGPLIGKSVTIITTDEPSGGKGYGRRLLQDDVAAAGMPNISAVAPEVAASVVAPEAAEVALTSINAGTQTKISAQGAARLSARSYNTRINPSDKCSLVFPKVEPSLNGATAFIYHPQAVAQFRLRVLARWFNGAYNGYKFNEQSFAEALTEKATADLGATLTYLTPANCITITTGKYPRK